MTNPHERLCELLTNHAALFEIYGWTIHQRETEAMLTRLRSSGPDGLRVVPVTPTETTIEDMVEAMTLAGGYAYPKQLVRAAYKAVLRAAGGERADG